MLSNAYDGVNYNIIINQSDLVRLKFWKRRSSPEGVGRLDKFAAFLFDFSRTNKP